MVQAENYLQSAISVFRNYKQLGEKALAQLADSAVNTSFNSDSNSVAIIVKHLHGNMRSRWTDFLTTDGEKSWRNRDEEFEGEVADKTMLMALWEEGWQVLFKALESLTQDDMGRTVYIRGEAHTVTDAITRQVAHYSYHVGQLVYLSKMYNNGSWESLSIPKGKSAAFNDAMFKQ